MKDGIEVGSVPERAAQLARIRLLVAEADALQLALNARTHMELLVAARRLELIYAIQLRRVTP